DNGRIVQQEGRTYTLKVDDRHFAELMQRGFLYTVNVPVKKAGAYQLRVAVRDSESERVGSANQFIEVPDIGKKRLTLSGLVISGADPAKRKTAQQAAAQVASQPGSDKEGAAEDADPLAGHSMRIVRRGMELDYAFMISNAQPEPGEYVLQVIVTDKLAKEKYRVAAQWMDFELMK